MKFEGGAAAKSNVIKPGLLSEVLAGAVTASLIMPKVDSHAGPVVALGNAHFSETETG